MDQDKEGDAIQVALRQMGYCNLKSQQESVVCHFLSGKDVFVSLPTGSGKSLCYSLLPLVYDQLTQRREAHSIVIVVSPLIALMKD